MDILQFLLHIHCYKFYIYIYNYNVHIFQVTVESIYIAIQTFIYACLLYPMIGFPWTIAKSLWFYYYLLTSIIYFTMFGMMIVSLSPNPQISAVIVYFFLCLWNLFSGFIIPRPVSHFCTASSLNIYWVLIMFDYH